jgi:hypothetical protein
MKDAISGKPLRTGNVRIPRPGVRLLMNWASVLPSRRLAGTLGKRLVGPGRNLLIFRGRKIIIPLQKKGASYTHLVGRTTLL